MTDDDKDMSKWQRPSNFYTVERSRLGGPPIVGAEITPAEIDNAQKAEIARLRAEVERLKENVDIGGRIIGELNRRHQQTAPEMAEELEKLRGKLTAAMLREAALRGAAEAVLSTAGKFEHYEAEMIYLAMQDPLDHLSATLAAHPAPEPAGEGETDDDA